MKTLLQTLMFCAIFFTTIVALFSLKNGTVDGPEWIINSSIITIAIYIAISMTRIFSNAFEAIRTHKWDYKSHSIGYMPTDKLDTTKPPKSRDRLYLELSDCDGMCKFCNQDLKFNKNESKGNFTFGPFDIIVMAYKS